MRATNRALARRQIDKQLRPLKNADALVTPTRGWIRPIREALGMTTRQFAKRLGVSQPRAMTLEQSETRGTLTLESLERAAQALNCRLVYAFVPAKSLETLAIERATLIARKRLKPSLHSMALEGKRLDPDDAEEQVKELAGWLLRQPGSALWEEA
jgi:predicted DNA-binding mobile mystery protein A